MMMIMIMMIMMMMVIMMMTVLIMMKKRCINRDGDNDDGEHAAEEVAAEKVKCRKSFKTIPGIAEILLAFEDLASVHHRSVLFPGAHVLLPTFKRDSKFADFK